MMKISSKTPNKRMTRQLGTRDGRLRLTCLAGMVDPLQASRNYLDRVSPWWHRSLALRP
jgi:hypothetical protein